ncbi:MAG: PAS domain-containing protein [Rhizomicrobium sp.]
MEKANQKFRALLALWNEKRGTRQMPARGDLDVSALKPWLGNLALIDVGKDGQAKFRLCGTNLHARFGGEMTRRSVSALDVHIGGELQNSIFEVCQSHAPKELRHDRVIEGTVTSFRELCLPLSDDGQSVHMLLLASYPVKQRETQG